MKRLVLVTILALLSALNTWAQTTTVTGTVADANANAYFPGTVSAFIQLNTGQPLPAGVPASGSIGPVATTSGGNFSVTVASPFTWVFTICGVPVNIGPRGNSTPTQICFSTGPIAISGGSQSITGNLPTVPVIGPGGSGGGISSVSSLPGTCTSGTSANVQLSASIIAGGITYGPSTEFYCDSTNHYSPVSQGSGASPIMGFYLSPQCPPSNAGNCFNTPADTQQANDCASASGTPDINCSTSHFVSTDCVGGSGCTGTGTSKRAMFFQTCMASVNLAANSNNGPFRTDATTLSIATFISATHVTLSANAQTTVTVSGGFPQGGCFVWGHPDDAGAESMNTAMQAAPYCPKGFLAAANYFFTTMHWFVNPPACAVLGASGGINAGNVVYAAGFELEGRGRGNTVIYLPPTFPESGTCNHGLSGVGCWVIPLEGRWSDFQITGGGDRVGTNLVSLKNIIEMDGPAELEHFLCVNFGQRPTPTVANSIGIAAYGITQLTFVNLSACGTRQLVTSVSSTLTGIRVWVENTADDEGIGTGELTDYFSYTGSTFSKYDFTCYDCFIGQERTNTASPAFLFVNRGGHKIKWYRGALSTESGPNINNNFGYDCVTTAGCLLDIEDASLDMNNPVLGTGNIAINCTVACTNILKNTVLRGSSGGSAYTDVTASKFISEGGNTLGAMNVNAGSLLSLAPSDTVVSGAAPSCTFTSGGGTSPSCAIQTGSTNESGVIIASTGTGSPGSQGTITLTFVGTYTLSATAPSCKFVLDNSGTAWGAEAVVFANTQSTTAPVLAWTNINAVALAALTVSSPYRIAYSCGLRP